MPFRNRRFAKKVKEKPCEWCGWQAASRHAAHIVDEVREAKKWNAISFCPNCATVFDDIIRPKLYKALNEYGAKNLPTSWKQSNKLFKKVD
ncbi:MAG: hypothetical protein HYY86_03585 [Candidatus Harrisonbacteria bacterium]|nr:hypothetical protein [Candidatus Harrisonbacteria bacterium]